MAPAATERAEATLAGFVLERWGGGPAHRSAEHPWKKKIGKRQLRWSLNSFNNVRDHGCCQEISREMEQCVIFSKNSINKIKWAGRDRGHEQLSGGFSRRRFLSSAHQQKLLCESQAPMTFSLLSPHGGGEARRVRRVGRPEFKTLVRVFLIMWS